MKKILLLFTTFIILNSAAIAKNIEAVSLDAFSTNKPDSIYRLQLLETKEVYKGTYLPAGAIMDCKVIDINHATIGKRNAYFEVIPHKITTNKKIYVFKNPPFYAKVIEYKPVSPTKVATRVAKTGAGFIVTGLSQAISFVQGVVSADDGSRVKAGFKKVYKDSPLAYIEKGEELSVKPGDILTLKIKRIEY
jgi:hypothetical protein